jgi:hypothetical protein
MPDDTEAAALHARLETIIKEVEDAEAQAVAAHRRVQATRLILVEEEFKTPALEQTANAARQRVPSSPSSASSPTAARNSSSPSLRPTKTRSSPDFTFRRPQYSTSASW